MDVWAGQRKNCLYAGGGGGGYTIYVSGSYCFQYHYACITRPFRLLDKRMSAPL